MARKPRSQWSPAYRSRVEAAERKGKTGPAIRGHRRAEHVERKARSVEQTGLTPYERGRVLDYARKQAERTWRPEHGTKEAYRRFYEHKAAALASRVGYDQFRRIPALQKQLKAQAAKNWKRNKVLSTQHAAENIALMEALADELGIEDDLGMLHYN